MIKNIETIATNGEGDRDETKEEKVTGGVSEESLKKRLNLELQFVRPSKSYLDMGKSFRARGIRI